MTAPQATAPAELPADVRRVVAEEVRQWTCSDSDDCSVLADAITCRLALRPAVASDREALIRALVGAFMDLEDAETLDWSDPDDCDGVVERLMPVLDRHLAPAVPAPERAPDELVARVQALIDVLAGATADGGIYLSLAAAHQRAADLRALIARTAPDLRPTASHDTATDMIRHAALPDAVNGGAWSRRAADLMASGAAVIEGLMGELHAAEAAQRASNETDTQVTQELLAARAEVERLRHEVAVLTAVDQNGRTDGHRRAFNEGYAEAEKKAQDALPGLLAHASECGAKEGEARARTHALDLIAREIEHSEKMAETERREINEKHVSIKGHEDRQRALGRVRDDLARQVKP